MTAKCYVYPTGFAVAVTAEIAGSYTPRQLLTLVERLSTESVFAFEGANLPISLLVPQLLNGLQARVLGSPDGNATADLSSLTHATITKGSALSQPVEGDTMHGLLEGLCLLSSAPLRARVYVLENVMIPRTPARAAMVRGYAGNGRAAFDPTGLSNERKRDCLHENQVLAALQAGILLMSAKMLVPIRTTLNPSQTVIATRVAGLLGQLNGGGPVRPVGDIYQTRYVSRQIRGSSAFADANVLRHWAGHPPLLGAEPA